MRSLEGFCLGGNTYQEGDVYCTRCYEHSEADTTLAKAVAWAMRHPDCEPLYPGEDE